ncbi:MAG: cupin domain-containing protein [Alphaproteobacteria bacterium]|nr:cupin domain-containing protein [Alphaproteobacteria bacterium]
MAIPVHKPKREDILKCVARFDEITSADTGLPDQEIDGYRRTFYNALGFSQPAGSGDGSYSPVGDTAQPLINHLTPGFNLAYVEARPSQGVMMHTHDTNETFVVIAGTWMFEWEGDQGNDHVVLKERDIVSFEPGSQRRFECISAPDGADTGMILGVIGGDTPAAEFSPESIEKMRAAGVEVPQATE